jgi:hypothetical protein
MKEERFDILPPPSRPAGFGEANSEMGLSSPVLSDQHFTVGQALVRSVILQEGMQRRRKEQRCSKRHPHEATAEAY